MPKTINIRKHLLFSALVICVAHNGSALALSDEFTGYYKNETNECPDAVRTQMQTTIWSGITVTPIEIRFPDKAVCSISDETQKPNALFARLTCTNDLQRNGIYEFAIRDNRLTLTRKGERQTYLRCRMLSSTAPTNPSPKNTSVNGIDIGAGAQIKPSATRNTVGMKLKAPFP